ncbi:MAG: DNA-formamidopyrimidine glycosylase family protein [Pirellulales bacterium]
MPEGDTIFRTARTLRQVLSDQLIERAKARVFTDGATTGFPGSVNLIPGPHFAIGQQWHPVESFAGRIVEAVEPQGKHMVIVLDDGRAIHSHLGMTGAWHVYRPGEPWQKPEKRARLVLEVSGFVVICFTPMVLELCSPTALRRHRFINGLGPDLLAPEIDIDDMIARFRRHNRAPIGEAVMNQTIVCGIGNIYKSELLFLSNINPFAPVSSLADDALRDLLELARDLMRQNLQEPERTTRYQGDGHRLWVYPRTGQPCFLCGTTIQIRRQGELGRTTYWCARCQEGGV